jgi:hypothetical protein
MKSNLSEFYETFQLPILGIDNFTGTDKEMIKSKIKSRGSKKKIAASCVCNNQR